LLPVTENFGALELTVQVQGEPPNSGKLVFTEILGDPPIDIVIVWNGQSFQPPEKADGDVQIPPAVQEPATISFGVAPSFVRGDVTGNGTLDLSDGISVLYYLFGGGPTPPCLTAADADDTGEITMGDGVYVLMYLFAGGSPPAAPFPLCGPDVTPDALTCEAYEPCG
jgi:hypothetical protein